MKPLARRLPSRLAPRFALAAAGLAAGVLLLASLGAWWLIQREHEQAFHQLAASERQFRAAAVGSDLAALAERMAEVAASTILATGLVDSAGRETYLAPFLNGIRQINGVPVQVLFTDFEGKEIATNGEARFTAPQRAWLRQRLDDGHAAATLFPGGPRGPELVAVAPMIYDRTATPEGAVLYKIALADLRLQPPLQLEWGAAPASPGAARVPVPPVFEPLGLRVRGEPPLPAGKLSLFTPQLLGTLAMAGGVFIVVALGGMQLARLLTRDLSQLQAFSSRFMGEGLEHERAPVRGSAEVASLAEAINRMLDRLNEQHSALRNEREKLKQLTVALQAADRRKDDFLAMLAHELRNPLAPISTGAELLRLLSADPRVADTAEVIARQVRHMTKIVDDLLDVSRVTRGLVTLDKVPLDLAAVVATAVEQARPLMDARRHTLTLHLPPGPLPVNGDRARLVQVVSNLLNNAAKYTPDGGRIEVSLDAGPDQWLLRVKDNGIGIAPELMPEIFDLFTQGSRSADRSQGGLGLGLALVRDLAALHGGHVAAHSDGAGQGATFTLTLPRGTLAPAAAPQPAALDAPAARPLRVMVVDDNADAAASLAALLQLQGHAVEVQHDGPSALARVQRAQAPAIDAFVLDIGLPGMDGNVLAQRLRALPAARCALLVALTGYGQGQDRERSARAGFDHHLVKPADPEALAQLLAHHAAARGSATATAG
jgi:signal transduction histidine kinase/ActR/RegA family two-component response regulator